MQQRYSQRDYTSRKAVLLCGFKKDRAPRTVDVPSEDLLLSPGGCEKVVIEEEPEVQAPKRGGLAAKLKSLLKKKEDEHAGILDNVNLSESSGIL